MKKKFNDEVLLKYTESFDLVEKKYGINRDLRFKNDLKNEIYNYELTQQTNHLYKKNFGYIFDDVKLVYGNDDKVNCFISIFNSTEQRIINQFLNIPGINQLYSDKYFDFEWDMHTGRNFDEHKCDYYRDHFIHQVRDMIMVESLINEFDFYYPTKEILNNRNNSKISYYCNINKKKFVDSLVANSDQKRLLDKCARELNMKSDEYYEEYYYHYIINASGIMAALFHDIGYPMRHFIRVRNRASDYMPSMYMFIHNDSDSFDRVASILNNSLLFQIIDNIEIKNRLSQNCGYDHGAYSAIAFLMQFYDAGLIYSLPVEKRVSIELAAVAIYNHTLKYRKQSKKHDSYYQPVFSLNPIAYLLRLCDDTQEWNRIYFEFSEHGDVLFCDNCNTPLLKYQEKTENNELSKYYKCACGKSIKKSVLFNKRRLYLVETSKELQIIQNDNKDLFFDLNYDLFLLLRMSYLNNTYAKYRIKELNSQKLIMEGQRFSDACRNMHLRYFISSNPLLLKSEILRRFLVSKDFDINSFDKIDNNFAYSIYKELCFETKKKRKDTYSKCATDRKQFEFYFNRSIVFYGNILKAVYNNAEVIADYCFGKDNENNYEKMIENLFNGFKDLSLAEYFDFGDTSLVYSDVFNSLIKDVFLQYIRIIKAFGSLEINDSITIKDYNEYHKQFLSDNSIYNDINTYCDIKYIDSYNINRIDYFSDLFIFEKLNNFSNYNNYINTI